MLPFVFVLFWTFEDKIENVKLQALVWNGLRISFVISLTIEMLQLFLRLGTWQLSDILYNTLGGGISGLLYYVFYRVRVSPQTWVLGSKNFHIFSGDWEKFIELMNASKNQDFLYSLGYSFCTLGDHGRRSSRKRGSLSSMCCGISASSRLKYSKVFTMFVFAVSTRLYRIAFAFVRWKIRLVRSSCSQ